MLILVVVKNLVLILNNYLNDKYVFNDLNDEGIHNCE